jgi:hypothetical protein
MRRLCPTVTPVVGFGNAISYGCAHCRQSRGNMKEPKKISEHVADTKELPQSSDVASDDDTKRLRTLTVQELERLLKDKKLGP